MMDIARAVEYATIMAPFIIIIITGISFEYLTIKNYGI